MSASCLDFTECWKQRSSFPVVPSPCKFSNLTSHFNWANFPSIYFLARYLWEAILECLGYKLKGAKLLDNEGIVIRIWPALHPNSGQHISHESKWGKICVLNWYARVLSRMNTTYWVFLVACVSWTSPYHLKCVAAVWLQHETFAPNSLIWWTRYPLFLSPPYILEGCVVVQKCLLPIMLRR